MTTAQQKWTAQQRMVAREVSLRRPDLARGDGIAAVLMADPSLTADEVIVLLSFDTYEEA